jgi:hypothetical protein
MISSGVMGRAIEAGAALESAGAKYQITYRAVSAAWS